MSPERGSLFWRVAPTVLAALFAAAYLIIGPRSPDLAAHIFRAELFAREGFTIWNGEWYGGHHTPAYSVLSPPLGWILTPQVMGALSAVAATAAFTEVARGHWGPRAARLGTMIFGAGSATMLFTNRLPFALGVAFAMAAVLALQRRPTGRGALLAPVLAILCALSSPVAALYLAMVGAAYALAATGDGLRSARRAGIAMGAGAFLTPVLLNVAFPEGGYAPILFGTYVAIPVFCLAAWFVIPSSERTLRAALVLYVAGATLAYLLPTPVGNNAVRFGALMGAPVLACVIAAKGRWRPVVPLVGLLLALGVWQWSAAARDTIKAFSDPVADPAYFDPVREYLRLLPDQRRVEIPFTLGHWEGAEVAAEAPLARGWLRQLDTGHHPIFYKGGLNELTYASWLSENAVRYVALPDAKPDASTYRERALIERGLPYLKLKASFEHWRIYEVTLPAPIVLPQGDANIALEQLGSDDLLLRVIKPGTATLRVRWTPYWLAKGGCVEKEGVWTRVTAPKEGFLRLVTRFSPERIVQRGKRCNGI